MEKFVVEFDVDKNGMRFPSLVRIDGVRYFAIGGPDSVKSKRRRVVEVEQIYRKYEFFGVRTVDYIRDVLAAER